MTYIVFLWQNVFTACGLKYVQQEVVSIELSYTLLNSITVSGIFKLLQKIK